MKATAGLQQATVTTHDGITMNVVPQGDGYVANVKAQKWTLPVGLPLKLDSLQAEAVYANQRLEIPSLKAALYGGTLESSAQLDWKKHWQLNGKFNTTDIELDALSKLFSKAVWVSGKLTGKGGFNSSAENAGELANKLVLDDSFSVDKGILHGLDLAKAASLFIKQDGQGGETQFDQLYGKVHTVGKQIELRDMKVASGLLAADGGVKISPEKTLQGVVNVELKQGLGLVTVPLQVSGTVDAPVVLPTKAALAGAAAGTAVLGPLGTGLGLKAGAAWDKLFGGKK